MLNWPLKSSGMAAIGFDIQIDCDDEEKRHFIFKNVHNYLNG